MNDDDLLHIKAALERAQAMPEDEYERRRAELHPQVVLGSLDLQVEREYLRLKAVQQARRLLDETTYAPPQQLDWASALDNSDGLWLVPELIGRGGLVLLVAKATIGKTFLSIDLICSGALGMTWAGRTIPQFKTLVYLSEGQRNYARRYAAWAKANNVDLDLIKPHVQIFGDVQLTSSRYIDDIRRQCDTFEPDLVVFDTFSGTSGVSDENDAALVGGVLETTRQAAQPATVMFIHHPNKASERTTTIDTRGSGTLRNNVDTVLVMYESDKRVNTGPRNFVSLSSSPSHGGKVKDAMPTTIGGFYLDSVDLGATPSGLPITSAVMRWTGDRRRLTKSDLSILKHLPTTPTKIEEYQAAAGLSRSTAYRHLEESVLALKLPDGRWKRLTDDDFDSDAILQDLSTFVAEDNEFDSEETADL